MSKAEEEEQARLERAREIGLFRYLLIQEAADPALSSRQRGAMVREIAAASMRARPGSRSGCPVDAEPVDPGVAPGGFDALVPSPRQPSRGPRRRCWSWRRR